jgi:hypothetical protein
MLTNVESEIGNDHTEKAFPGNLCRHTYNKLYRWILPLIERERDKDS